MKPGVVFNVLTGQYSLSCIMYYCLGAINQMAIETLLDSVIKRRHLILYSLFLPTNLILYIIQL